MKEFRDGLTIDATKLDAELSKQAATYLFVAEKSIEAETQYELFKVQLGQLRAAKDDKYRQQLTEAKVKITEALVSGEVERDEDYCTAQKQLVALRANKELLKAMREAYYMRKDLLIQMAIKARSEIEGMLSESVKFKAAA